jgi:catechol 2,3-dioxygenase-like lactoylglutathione lyase family enzyme
LKKNEPPQIFRILLPARDLEQSRRFYEILLSLRGRPVAGGRIYFDCGSVLLGILDYSSHPDSSLTPPTEALYFATSDLGAVHRRARELGCLTPGLLHEEPDSPLGEIVVRPWGERSFYAQDPSGNSLCFVDERTLFTGTPKQVAALARVSDSRPHTRSVGGQRTRLRKRDGRAK